MFELINVFCPNGGDVCLCVCVREYREHCKKKSCNCNTTTYLCLHLAHDSSMHRVWYGFRTAADRCQHELKKKHTIQMKQKGIEHDLFLDYLPDDRV